MIRGPQMAKKSFRKVIGTDLASLADMLARHGRGKDKMLAHITPGEAKLLKKLGGSGTTNPKTGLPEFDDSGVADFSYQAPPIDTYQAPTTYSDTPATDTIAAGGESFNPSSYTSPTQADYSQGFTSTAPAVGPNVNAWLQNDRPDWNYCEIERKRPSPCLRWRCCGYWIKQEVRYQLCAVASG